MKTDDGQKVTSADLRTDKGKATTTGVRSPYRQAQAPGMKPERLARLLRAADEGDTEAFFTLATEIEERDLHYGAVLTSRKLGVTSIPPTIQAATTKRRDVKIAEDVQELVTESSFNKLVFHMLDALGKGISFNEILWETSASRWRPTGYRPVDQRWFTWDKDDLETPLLRTDESPNGERLSPYKWIVHESMLATNLPMRGGLARPAVIAWALKSYTLAHWMGFLEIFGIPWRLGTYPNGAKQEEKDALLDAVRTLGSDAGGIIPEGTKIEIMNTTTRGGTESFVMTAEYWDKQISKRVLGQTMSTDEGTGRGKAQAETQSKQELKINRHDARQICATIREQLIKPYVRLNYGDSALIPTIRIETRTAEEISFEMTNIKTFVGLGGRVEEAYVRDILSIPEPAPESPLLRAGAATPAVPEGEDVEDAPEDDASDDETNP